MKNWIFVAVTVQLSPRHHEAQILIERMQLSCVLKARNNSAEALGDSSHVTMLAGIGLLQMWHQRGSNSPPPPPPLLSLPLFLCLSLPIYLSVLLYLLPQHPPPPPLTHTHKPSKHRDAVCRCCSGVGGLVHSGRTFHPLSSFPLIWSVFPPFVSLPRPPRLLRSSFAPFSLCCGCLRASALWGGRNQRRALQGGGSCAQLAMPCPGFLWPLRSFFFCPRVHPGGGAS